MKIKIRTKDFRFSMPVPVSIAGFVLKFLPERLFIEMRTNIPDPYAALVTKENLNMILWECMDIIKENKGLEIVHVEASDGTFVSIRL